MANANYTVWIGTNSVRGSRGIYTLRVDGESLRMELTHSHGHYNAGAIAFDSVHNRLLAASEGMIFDGKASGGLTAYAADAEGALSETGKTWTIGQRPCSVALDPGGTQAYVANFFGGSLAMIPIREDGGLEPVRRLVVDPVIPGWLHALHCVAVMDGGKTVAALSVSRSSVVLLDAETGEEQCAYCFGEKVFARYLAVRGDFVYAMIQDPGDIYVLHRESGRLECRQVIRMLPVPPDFYGTSALRITPDGSLLLAGVRRTNTIAVFRIRDDGTLEQVSTAELPGETPRDFAVTPDGRAVITALQASDEVCIHAIDYDRGTLNLVQTGLRIPSPAAVAIRQEG